MDSHQIAAIIGEALLILALGLITHKRRSKQRKKPSNKQNSKEDDGC